MIFFFQAFSKDPPTTVFLLSMRAGAVGINLTQANNVFLLEPVRECLGRRFLILHPPRIGTKEVIIVIILCYSSLGESRHWGFEIKKGSTVRVIPSPFRQQARCYCIK